jgi:hypothetical protein
MDAMIPDGPSLSEHPAQALGWLDLLASLMPETVKLEVSGYLVFVLGSLVALWIWRRYPVKGAGQRNE